MPSRQAQPRSSGPSTTGPSLVGHYERTLLMERSDMMRHLGGEGIRRFAEHMRERTFKKGTVIHEAGELPAECHLVVQGRIDVIEGEHVIMSLGPGATLGFVVLLSARAGTRRGVAAEDTLTLELPTDALLEILEDNFSLVGSLLSGLSRGVLSHNIARPGTTEMPSNAAFPPCRCGDGGFSLVDRLLFLKRMPAFAEVSLDALAEYARGLVEVRIPAGVVAWREGDRATHLLLVVQGSLGAVRADGLGTLVVKPYGVVGGADLLGVVPRSHTVTAMTDSFVLRGDQELIIDVFEDNFEMAMSFLSVLARELAALQVSAATT